VALGERNRAPIKAFRFVIAQLFLHIDGEVAEVARDVGLVALQGLIDCQRALVEDFGISNAPLSLQHIGLVVEHHGVIRMHLAQALQHKLTQLARFSQRRIELAGPVEIPVSLLDWASLGTGGQSRSNAANAAAMKRISIAPARRHMA